MEASGTSLATGGLQEQIKSWDRSKETANTQQVNSGVDRHRTSTSRSQSKFETRQRSSTLSNESTRASTRATLRSGTPRGDALGCGGSKNDQSVESKAQLIHHIYPSTSRALCTERGAPGAKALRFKDSRVDHEGIQSIAFNAGRVGRVFASSEEELWD